MISENDNDKKKKEKILLQFGKINDENYALDFQFPFTIFEAFCVGVSMLKEKKLCE